MLPQDPHQLLARELRETQLQLAGTWLGCWTSKTHWDLWMVSPQTAGFDPSPCGGKWWKKQEDQNFGREIPFGTRQVVRSDEECLMRKSSFNVFIGIAYARRMRAEHHYWHQHSRTIYNTHIQIIIEFGAPRSNYLLPLCMLSLLCCMLLCMLLLSMQSVPHHTRCRLVR